MDSPAIESFLTENSFLARAPYLAAVEVDPRRVIVQLTSNKAQITVDLASRSSCVRILKRPEDYQFRHYPEGDILDRVRANQPLYLGAIFAVVRAWYEMGQALSDETRHDFRPWARTLDWIVKNILGTGPLVDGHRQTQIRMSTPALNFLRDAALAVRNSGHTDQWLRASSLIDILSESPGVELPGLTEGGDLADEEVRKKVLQGFGRRTAQCFGTDNVRVVDGFEIQRRELDDPVNRRTIREYCFRAVPDAVDPCAYAPTDRRTIGAEAAERAPGAAHGAEPASSQPAEPSQCACAAPMDVPMKTPCAPNAPIGSIIARREPKKTHEFQNSDVTSAVNSDYSRNVQLIRICPGRCVKHERDSSGGVSPHSVHTTPLPPLAFLAGGRWFSRRVVAGSLAEHQV
jgi:hypothetical protein